MQWSTIRRASAALALLLVSGASIAPAQNGPPSKDGGKPLVIAKQGYFFVGGKYHTFQGAQYVSGQAYVEYQIPQNQKHPYPIVMIEGFGLTVSEALWKATPVVGGRAGGIPLQLGPESPLLVDSTEECGDRVADLLEDPAARRRHGLAGRERVRREFLIPRLLRDELRLLRTLAVS